MRFQKPTFLLFFLFLIAAPLCLAQVKKSAKSAGYSSHRVSHSKARIVCPIFVESQYPYQGIGFKLGDPFALTYKLYPSKNWSFAIDAGKVSSGLYSDYYRGLFRSYARMDTLSTDPVTSQKSTINYITHKVESDWLMEAKLLYQWDAEKISKGLQLYAGLGWQSRSTTLRYDYTYHNATTGSDEFGHFTKSRFTYGPVVILGFEYSYFSLPISSFIEVEMFTDDMADPGYHRFQGGVGLRYVF